VRPGTPWSSIVTGVLGIQPRPAAIEAAVWVVYLAVMLVVVLRQPRAPSRPADPVQQLASARP
jgi:high-affinity iron transporter